MVTRMERSAESARRLVELIDRRSLQEGIGVTRGFVSRILQEISEPGFRFGD